MWFKIKFNMKSKRMLPFKTFVFVLYNNNNNNNNMMSG